VIQDLIDFIFPPFCLACGEKCTHKYLCLSCWGLCELPDPVTKCRHCFEELDKRGTLCSRCRDKPLFTAIRATVFDRESPAHFLGLDAVDAMASFAFLQWVQLEWPIPFAIIPMPEAADLAKSLSKLIDCPFVPALKWGTQYLENSLEEDRELLLIDISSPIELLQKAIDALSESFPKRIYLLTLFPYGIYYP